MGKNRIFIKNELNDKPLLIVENKHTQADPLPDHFHDTYELIYIVNGSGILKIGTAEYAVGCNSVVLFDKYEKHQFLDNPDDLLTLYGIYFNSRLWHNDAEDKQLTDFICNMPLQKRIINISDNPFLIILPVIFREILFEAKNQKKDSVLFQKIKLSAILLTLKRFYQVYEGKYEDISSNRSESDKKVLNYIAFIEENYFKKNSLDSAAMATGLSSRQFSRIFKKITGLTFIDYLNNLKIKSAIRELRITGNIAAACFNSGFEELSYFYMIFKKQTGSTPKQYLKK